MHTPRLPKEPGTRRMVLRAIIKALCLFFAFNVAYGLINPLQRGMLPSLYNIGFSGRVRFMKDYEFDAYRLIDDHIISRARSDTFNIVILGSSEMWGTRSMADQSVPVIMDRMGLVAADGRPVRVYNLGHLVPYGFTDLALMEVVFRRNIPVDLVVFSTVDTTLTSFYDFQPIALANFNLQIDVIEHYGLFSVYAAMDASRFGRSIPVFLQFWEDRGALRVWLEMQMRGPGWSLNRYDLSNVPEDHLTSTIHLENFYTTLMMDRFEVLPTPDFLAAFKQMSRERGVPVIVLETPLPFEENEFAPWLKEQLEVIKLPLIDCWSSFEDPTAFEDYYHIRRESHDEYASLIASSLGDPRLAAEGAGLPLQLPPDFVPLPQSCKLYPTLP